MTSKPTQERKPMSITELALQAERDAATQRRDEGKAKREAALDKIIEDWERKAAIDGRYGDSPTVPPMPERHQFQWFAYGTLPYENGRGRNPHVYGWAWEIDGVTFIYDDSYSGHGTCVILTCPDCGERHASSWYGLADLGKKLRLQRTSTHVCRDLALRTLAFAIREASAQTGLSPQGVTSEALMREEVYR